VSPYGVVTFGLRSQCRTRVRRKTKLMSKLLLAILVIAVSSIFSASAMAHVSPRHAREYRHAYHVARHKFGPGAVGCNLIGKRGSCHHKTSDLQVVHSIKVLHRMIHPIQVPESVPSAPASDPVSYTSMDSLESCIIFNESHGDPEAVNGQYEGIGQWSPTAWAEDGGTRYASTPLGASYAEQEVVLRSEGDSGMSQQQGQYDGCA
jgi:Transglycosylase-like domain